MKIATHWHLPSNLLSYRIHPENILDAVMMFKSRMNFGNFKISEYFKFNLATEPIFQILYPLESYITFILTFIEDLLPTECCDS